MLVSTGSGGLLTGCVAVAVGSAMGCNGTFLSDSRFYYTNVDHFLSRNNPFLPVLDH
jgi:hypothetical protein